MSSLNNIAKLLIPAQKHKSYKAAALFCLRSLCYTALFVLSLTSQVALFAEDNATSKIAKQSRAPVSIMHTPPKAETMPYPGQNLTITVRLTNTRETERKLVVALVKDGRFMQVDAKKAYLNEVDQPTYDIVLPAPAAEMSYQFLLFAADGSITPSARYYLRRSCIPNLGVAEGVINPEIQGYQRLEKLVSEAGQLKNDVSGYEKVMGLLDELQKRVNK